MNTNPNFKPISDERRTELMRKPFSELMEDGIEELRINYPESYKIRIENRDLYIRLGKAVNDTFQNNIETGDCELLKEHMPDVYKQKFKDHFGYEPKSLEKGQ